MQVNQVSYQNHKSNPSFQQIIPHLESKNGTKVFRAVAGALTFRKRGEVIPYISARLAREEDFIIEEHTESSFGHFLRLTMTTPGKNEFVERILVRNQRGRTLARQIRDKFDQLQRDIRR